MKGALAGLIILCAIVLQVSNGSKVLAQEGTWEVLESKQMTFDTSPYCPSFIQEFQVEGFLLRQRLCVFDGERVKVGSFFANGGEPLLAIAYPLDREFHPLEGVCRGIAGCVYSSSGDVLIARSRGPNNTFVAMIFRRFSQRIHRTLSDLTGKVTYTFDTSSPDYVLVNEDNTPLSIGAVALSRNGNWAVVEEKNIGVTIINLKDFSTKQVLSPGPLYGYGKDPREELAISNDGSNVALMGENAGIVLVQVNSTCGGFSEECPRVMPQTTTFTPTFRFGAHPAFDNGGGQLSFYVAAVGQPNRRVVLERPGYEVPRLKYVALGDSFSSGEGETHDSFYQVRTNDAPDHCHVSVRSYAFIVSAHMNIPYGGMRNVACAGAKIQDVIGRDEFYEGQGRRLRGDVGKMTKLESALDLFVPGWVHQGSFVSRYQPEVVTLGIGGNDAGLMAKLKTCAMPGVCEWVAAPEARMKTGVEIQRLFDVLTTAYRSLMNDSPRSLLYAVGYPQIISSEGLCDPVTSFLLDHEERIFIRQGISYLNAVIKRAAESVGVNYVDVEDSMEGQELCSGSVFAPAMNGLRLGDDIAPSKDLPMLKLIGSETFHPTPIGHSLLGKMIIEKYGDLTQPHTCVTCWLEPRAPFPPDYWTEGVLHANPASQYAVDVLEGDHIDPSEPTIEVNVPPGMLEPGSSARIELHSESSFLGEVQVDSQGGFSREVTIPGNTPEGFHGLHILGMSYTHSPVDLYETVSYGEVTEQEMTENVSEVPVKLSEDERSSVLGAMTLRAPRLTYGQSESSSLFGNIGSNPPLLLVLVGLFAVASGFLVGRYNGYMTSIRSIVKKLIPRGVFKKIEPTGHLLESVLMNIRYGFPGRKLRIIGVTGTNGKTTTSFMIHRLLHESGVKVGLLSTVANGVGGEIIPRKEHMTTTKASVLQSQLRKFARAGVEWVVVETSSHALAQNRVWGVPYEIAVMTNITHDHLDYHGTFKNYVEAKRRLFKIANRNGLRFGVVNAEDPSATKFVKTVANSTTYGIGKGELKASKLKLASDHTTYKATIDDDSYDIRVNIPGEFNVSNSLAAIAVGRKLGLSKAQIEKGIAALSGVMGRMNIIDEGQKFKVLVDFASTPDGFEKFFQSVRPLTKGKLIAVFGSAGRRDESKRSVQGNIAGKYADIVIATEEDDRDVDGAQILKQIASGAKKAGKVEGKDLFLISNREEAIGFAMTQATGAHDVVALLGKGHEQTIERADGIYPWDEAEVARAALQAFKESH
jgi:UDP-N-acetylmuramoyl-L-alanyl-D-glutamate--2,6-diaminopimelate ligase